ncbi:Glutamate--cysteine ligase [Spathaspora sp. JA1]|nr:Glutamate--cysteine ligase [Spathaspora sp. JA1]
MGLLSLGTPLDWHQSRKYNEHVRYNGITQLINIFKQHAQTRTNDRYLWGDEVEYMMVDIDHTNRSARLSIDKDYILNDLNDENKSLYKSLENNVCFHPEYGRFMLEATPAKPYDGECIDDYVYVETNMILRRKISQEELPGNIKPITLTSFPRMGCDTFTSPPAKPIGPASQSLFLPDEIINRHARFPTLTANIRKRRGHKVAINLPLYPDKHTKLLDDSIKHRDLFKSDQEPFIGASRPGYVYMDSMGFGMGSSCLQITMQTKNITEARYLYDSLAPLSPVMLAFSAAAPIFKGHLVNQDVRWNVVSGAVDDRTFIERGVTEYPGYNKFGGLDIDQATNVKDNLKTNAFGDIVNVATNDGKPIQHVPKSRYDSVANYLCDSKYETGYYQEKFNDLNAPINKSVYDRLRQEEPQLFDHHMANHFAHLFIRDPLVLFSERIDQDNSLENDHFENIQSTNWQTLRFKPPALYDTTQDISSTPGWRVEFRPMEIQLTDFENAAYSIFLSLLSKAIIKFKPNFYIPLSKVELNMEIAHRVDAAINEKFWFKDLDDWNLNYHEFQGYDLSWFDRYINIGNDELGGQEIYMNGYSASGSTVSLVNGTALPNGAVPNGMAHDESISNGTSSNGKRRKSSNGMVIELEQQDVSYSKYSIDEIINGDVSGKFPGLIRLVIKLIATDLIPKSCHCPNTSLANDLTRIKYYLTLISKRAKGEIPTTAHWIRNKVLNHHEYKRDSKVSDFINYDLINDAIKIGDLSDRDVVEGLFGEFITDYLFE